MQVLELEVLFHLVMRKMQHRYLAPHPPLEAEKVQELVLGLHMMCQKLVKAKLQQEEGEGEGVGEEAQVI